MTITVNSTVIINTRNCPYKLRGKNISEMRRVDVRRIAEAMGIKDTWDMSKNDMLTKLLALFQANAMDHDLEHISGFGEIV